MKKAFLKKTASALLTGAMILSLTGCLDFGGGKKAVLAAAEVLAENIVAADASELISISSIDKKSKEATELTEILSLDGKSDEDKAFYAAVEKTIEYEIDEESFTSKKGEASIDIVFTIADYEAVLKDEYTKIDDLTAAVKKADTKEIKFTAEFVKEDKEWIADNVGSKKFLKIYDYRTADIQLALTPDMVKGFIDKSMSAFWLANDGKYKDTPFIEYNYYFTSDVLDYKDRGVKIYFKLSKDGSEVFTGAETVFGESTNVKCKASNEDLGLKISEYLEAGNYKIDLYMKDAEGDHLIDTVSVSVEKTPPTTTQPNTALKGEGDYFTFRNSEFKKYVLACGWLNTDNTLKNAKTYSKDVKNMCFSFKVDPSCTAELDYAYYYSEKSDKASLEQAMKTAVYHNSVKPQKFTEGYFYDFLYKMDQAKEGVYIIAVFEHGTNNVIMVGYVTVS